MNAPFRFWMLVAAGAVIVAAPPHPAESAPPNVVLILIDDLGWHDLACQGNPLVDTPRIDALATEGMRFTDAYAAAPVCSPTRAAIATGQAPARLHITNHIPDQERFIPRDAKLLPAPMLDRLPLEKVTLAERLKTAGYATGFFGKWHLAGRDRGIPAFYPDHQGFDLNVGGCGYGGPRAYFDPYHNPTIADRKKGEYLPDRLADEAIEFMRAHREGPFFVCLWNYTVHWPMEAPQPLKAKYASRKGPGLNDTRYGAMIEAMDAAAGHVLDAIDDLKLRDNTLVIFTSDNGGFAGVSDNRPLRGAKGHLYEGGIRVPLIIRWPGVVRPGSVCHAPVISMDFYPTILAAAGLRPDPATPLDGDNLLPLLKETGTLHRQAIYFHFPNYAWHRSNRLGGAIRQEHYKLIERFDDGSVELFNLDTDPSEKHDLSDELPELAKALQEKLAAWRAEVHANMPVRRE